MYKLITSLITVVLLTFCSVAIANQDIRSELREAILEENWVDAIEILDQMIQLYPEEAEDFKKYKTELQQRLPSSTADRTNNSTIEIKEGDDHETNPNLQSSNQKTKTYNLKLDNLLSGYFTGIDRNQDNFLETSEIVDFSISVKHDNYENRCVTSDLEKLNYEFISSDLEETLEDYSSNIRKKLHIQIRNRFANIYIHCRASNSDSKIEVTIDQKLENKGTFPSPTGVSTIRMKNNQGFLNSESSVIEVPTTRLEIEEYLQNEKNGN